MKKRTIIIAMVVAAVAFIAIIGLSVGLTTGYRDPNKELKLVHIIMRHGVRTPASTYPKDPYINETFYPAGWGQLTNKGKLELYQTGKFLRRRYDSFLGKYYYPDQFYTQSTDVDRTKASMQLVNAGLWPPKDFQKWGGELDWQPVPVHSEPLDQDNLLLVRRPCAQYHLELDRLIASDPNIRNKLREHEQIFRELTQHTGMDIKSFEDIQDIFSTLLAEETFDLALPDWSKSYYPHRLLDGTIFSFIQNAYNDKMNRLKGGVLLKKLMSDWKGKADGTLKPAARKAFLYGGHDSTIVNILSTLKVWDPQLPVYGITILIELSQDRRTQEYGIEVYLRNTTKRAPFLLTIPNCPSFCTLNRLERLVQNVIPENWDEECKSDDPNYTPPPPGGP